MRDLVTQLQEGLTGRYSIERELGRGGMATVFLTRDLRHDRPVALKVLYPEIAAGVGLERFQQEIRLAAKLQHPHILAVHDSGDVPSLPGEPSLLWFTMPYVEGESLRDRLTHEVQLPVADALRIAQDVAGALDYAHRHGVIHRDIKPENILLTESHALVADFGIARAVTDESGGAGLTATGVTVGTVAYMSPEQSTGEHQLDGRTDQYSLACVVYEMLAGEPPFTGPTAQAVVTRRFTEEPRALRATRPGVPLSVEQAVTTALSRVPADRFASLADFARALAQTGTQEVPVATARPHSARRPFAFMLALGFLLGVGVLFAWLKLGNGGSGRDGPLLLAVLPFENQGDTSDSYFADGMTDEVRGKLAGLPGFQVIARASAVQYRRTAKPLREVARELGVRYLLTGTVRWLKAGTAQRVQVRPELVEIAENGSTLSKWEAPFDAPLTDVFQMQAEIAGKVATALRGAMTPADSATLAEAPTSNQAAYDEFLRGEHDYIGSSGPIPLRQALGHYQHAVALDSGFARAWARLAQVTTSIYYNFEASPELAEAARRGADKVLALAPRLPEAHLAMGYYYTLVKNDYARAIEAYQRGLALAPRHAELLGSLGLAEQGLGRLDEAIAHMRQGLTSDPRSLLYIRRLTRALNWARRFPESDSMARRALAVDPADASTLNYAALLRLSQGDLAGARSLFAAIRPGSDSAALAYWASYPGVGEWFLPDDQERLVLRLPPSVFGGQRSLWGSTLSLLAFRLGDRARARAYADSALPELRALLRQNPADADTHSRLALMLAVLGQHDEAIREGELGVGMRERDRLIGPQLRHYLILIYLWTGETEKALDQLEKLLGIPYYITPAWLRIDPNFDPVRQHPRFQELARGR